MPQVTGDGLRGRELWAFRSRQLLRFHAHLTDILSQRRPRLGDGENCGDDDDDQGNDNDTGDYAMRDLANLIELRGRLAKARTLASATPEAPGETTFPASWDEKNPRHFRSWLSGKFDKWTVAEAEVGAEAAAQTQTQTQDEAARGGADEERAPLVSNDQGRGNDNVGHRLAASVTNLSISPRPRSPSTVVATPPPPPPPPAMPKMAAPQMTSMSQPPPPPPPKEHSGHSKHPKDGDDAPAVAVAVAVQAFPDEFYTWARARSRLARALRELDAARAVEQTAYMALRRAELELELELGGQARQKDLSTTMPTATAAQQDTTRLREDLDKAAGHVVVLAERWSRAKLDVTEAKDAYDGWVTRHHGEVGKV